MKARTRSLLTVGALALGALVLVGILFVSRPAVMPATATDAPQPTRLPTIAAVSPLATPVRSVPASPLATPVASPRPEPQVSATRGATPVAAAVASPLASPGPEPTVAPTIAPTLTPTAAPTDAPTGEPADGPAIPVYTYAVVAEYPHDPEAFTQGLQLVDGELYEGTGLRGRSSLRRVDLATGAVLQQVDLDAEHFGEGIAVVGDRIYQLTWQSNVAFVYDRTTLTLVEQFTYPTEGWGLTFDGAELIMSDGTATLYRRDPATFAETGRIEVQAGGDRVPLLNELEFVNGEVFANIWQTDVIARIDPATGQVVGWIDLSGLLPATTQPVDVLNGIAYDAAADRLFVTGKLWPALFEIDLELQTP